MSDGDEQSDLEHTHHMVPPHLTHTHITRGREQAACEAPLPIWEDFLQQAGSPSYLKGGGRV